MTDKVSLGLYFVACLLHMSYTVLPYYVDSRHVMDLLQYMAVRNAGSDGTTPLPIVPGANNHSIAYVFQGSSRQVEVAEEAVRGLQKILKERNEFTILASIKQRQNSTGSIITFSVDGQRYLEVESSGRRNEIRLHYFPHPPGYQGNYPHPHTLTFPYRIADGNWHQMALSVSSHFVQLFIDCRKVYETQLASLDMSHIAISRNVRLWLGQRNERQAYFKGAIEYVKVVLSPEGHRVQCPHASTPCPTCAQYYQLENSVQELYKVIERLNKKLLETEIRLSAVEKCECMSSCQVNGTRYRDGESWNVDQCTTCTCRAGEVTCKPPVCPEPKCKHPVLKDGECCPSCLRHCYYSGKKYDHLEEYYPRECIKCTCRNGHMTCHREEQCPVLDCPPERQVAVEGECCKFCKGLDYCGKGHDCHQNATCYNLDTKYTCQCNDGFKGDGKTCEDLDECQSEGGHHGHYCHSNTKCINTLGSYRCECLPGYVRENQFACRELNECLLGLHDCHPNAECINTDGSFICQCAAGYHGDGKTCQPTCSEPCLNGGTCIAPDTCSCHGGYTGNHCQTDVDECREGLADCHPNSECINIPGQYYCKCKKGYHSNHYDNLNGLLCRDVNECAGWGGGHQCPLGTECVNTPGGYECLCQEHSECIAACQTDGQFHANGTVWEMSDEPCTQCICKDGEVRCSRRSCDCAAGYADPKCCPQCNPEQQCHHQELPITYYSGDTWIYQCQICECLRGEVDCWAVECPPLSCSKVVHEDGNCCPRCVDDNPCSLSLDMDNSDNSSLVTMVCFFDGTRYLSGDTWVVPWDACSTCTCQAGQICCTYNETCAAGRQRHELLTDQSLASSVAEARVPSHKRFDVAAYRKQKTEDVEDVELWHVWHGSPSENQDPGVDPSRRRPGTSHTEDGFRISTDRPHSPSRTSHGSGLGTVNIPDEELSGGSRIDRSRLRGPKEAGGGSGSGSDNDELISVARLKNRRTSDSELTSGDALDGSPGLESPTDSPIANWRGQPLSHAGRSRAGGRRKSSRRQGRRGSRRRRKRPQRVSSPKRTARDRGTLATRRPDPDDWSLLERELKSATSTKRHRESLAKDKRERSPGRRRKNFDGGG